MTPEFPHPELLHPEISGEHAPSLTYFPAENPNGAGVLICPGGGYRHLAIGHEGADIAAWLNARGFDAWMLRYRTAEHFPLPLHPGPIEDAKKAMETIRATQKVEILGVWGFSAGGHLAATLATQFDAQSQPDFAILAYPVIDLHPPFAHEGSRQHLVGEDTELVAKMSAHLNVSSQTPPTFLFHTADDGAVPVENSLQFFAALSRHKIPAELHVFQTGRHGVGLAPDDPTLSAWGGLLETWLERQKPTQN